jgi:hypothetical protein
VPPSQCMVRTPSYQKHVYELRSKHNQLDTHFTFNQSTRHKPNEIGTIQPSTVSTRSSSCSCHFCPQEIRRNLYLCIFWQCLFQNCSLLYHSVYVKLYLHQHFGWRSILEKAGKILKWVYCKRRHIGSIQNQD